MTYIQRLAIPIAIATIASLPLFKRITTLHLSLLTLSDIGFGLLVGLVILTRRVPSKLHPILQLLIVLLIWNSISALWSPTPTVTLIHSLSILIGVVGAIALINLQIPQWAFQAGWVALLLLQAPIAILQFWRQHHLGLQWLGERPIAPLQGIYSVLVVDDTTWIRAYGLTQHPNILGSALAIGLLLLVPLWLNASRWRRIGYTLLAILSLLALMYTFSRSALIGLLAGKVFFGFMMYQRHDMWQRYQGILKIAVFSVIGIVVLIGVLYRPIILSRLNQSDVYVEQRSVNDRIVLSRIALDVIQEHPLIGSGGDTFAHAVAPHLDGVDVQTHTVHNVYLLISAELGLIGGIIWLLIALLPPIIALRNREQLTLWSLGLTSALVALAIIDVFDMFTWMWPQGRALRWTLIALWADASSEVPPLRKVEPLNNLNQSRQSAR